jgi:type VI secretion system secreted protein Hcp
LTVDGINGANGSPCAFEIKDFSFGVENPTTIGSATGGAGAGKVTFSELTIKKTTDSASPVFFKNLVSGNHYKQVTLTMRKAGGDPCCWTTLPDL